jgi:pyruvate-formate lyase-activating enzyme
MTTKPISGIVPLSLNDYPSEISTVVFFQGCNFNCFYCHNKNLIPKREGNLNFNDVFEFIEKRKMFITAIVLTGGEPTIYKDKIFEFIKEIKKRYPHLKVKLDSNGSNLDVLGKLLSLNLLSSNIKNVKYNKKNLYEKGFLIDKIAIDLKGDENLYNILCKNKKVSSSFLNNLNCFLKLLKKEKLEDKVYLRTTIFEPYFNKKVFKFIFDFIPEGFSIYFQNFNIFKNFDDQNDKVIENDKDNTIENDKNNKLELKAMQISPFSYNKFLKIIELNEIKKIISKKNIKIFFYFEKIN